MTTNTSRLSPSELVPFARALVAEAGEFTQGFFRSADLQVQHKADGSPVTEADEGAEQLIRQAIAREFPADEIMGEEFGASNSAGGSSGRRWIIDPIDGTKSFTAGVPLYSNLLAVVDDGVPVLGIINLPALDEMIWATVGGGAFLNDAPCQVSSKSDLDGAYVMTSSVRYWPEAYLDAVLTNDIILRTWGDAYGYAMVATGRAEAMIDPRANVWDIAPIGVVLDEAGGTFTSLSASPNRCWQWHWQQRHRAPSASRILPRARLALGNTSPRGTQLAGSIATLA